MQSFLEDIKKVKDQVSLSPEVQMSTKAKLVQFMEATPALQESMLAEFSEGQQTAAEHVIKTSIRAESKS